MLIQAFNHPKKVVFLYMRNLNQLVFMIMCKKVVARSHGLRNVPMKVTGKHLIKVILMRQASHQLTIIDLVYLSQRSEIQWLVILVDDSQLLELLAVLIEKNVDKLRILINIILKSLIVHRVKH